MERINKTTQINYMFDRIQKIEFESLNEKVSNSQLRHIKNVLNKIDESEKENGKSICAFNKLEVIKYLKSYKASSITTLNTYFSILKKYVKHINNGDLPKTIATISSRDMEDLLVQEAHETRYITREEMFEVISTAVNPQDKALLLLIFEGVRGKDYDQLRLLREDQLNFEKNEIKLDNKTIKITDKRTMFVLKSAINQLEYFYERTNKDSNNEEVVIYQINEKNKYVIKKVMYNNQGLDAYVSNRIKTKINKFSKEVGREYLTGNTIYNSGLAERFMNHFDHRSPETISTKEINEYLKQNHEKIQPATLRRIAKYVMG